MGELQHEIIKQRLIEEGVLKPIEQIENHQLSSEEREHAKLMIGRIYEDIKQFLKNYVDMKEEDYEIVTLWIIGTYLHDKFETFPYLFVNAMRGSGKSRLLRIISALSKDGILNTSMKEAVLFRMGNKTLCIDEFEGINTKEAQPLREILNASYKKGMTITRMKKKRTMDGESYVPEHFEPYKPIAMANIWGMEEVLSDRCVTIILEKSNDQRRTRLSEDFENNSVVISIKDEISKGLVYLCSLCNGKGILQKWNKYVNSRYNYTTTYNTYTTLNTLNTPPTTESKLHDIEMNEVFNKIHDTEINGRNLELMMPFLIISRTISEECFTNVLEITKSLTKEKKKVEMNESRDVVLIDFISQMNSLTEFIPVIDLTMKFKRFAGEDEAEDKWISSRWVGRAMKRLNLVRDSRRTSSGREVIPNISKAKEKIKMFRSDKK